MTTNTNFNGSPTWLFPRGDTGAQSGLISTAYRRSTGSSARSVASGVVGNLSTSVDDAFGRYVDMIRSNTAQNNAWSAEQAQKNRDWQEKMVHAANKFNAEQAQLNRDWQERMNNANNAFNSQEAQKNRDWQAEQSATAHQREVKDLLAAGLNPVLSALNGNGAATTSGASASSGGSPSGAYASSGSSPSGAVGQTDTSANGALVSLLGALLSSVVQQENARLSAQTNLAVAEKYNQMSKYTAELNAETQLTTTSIQSAASKWIAELNAKTNLTTAQMHNATSEIVASISAAAQRYGARVAAWSNQEIAKLNAEINKELKELGIEADFKMQDTDLQWKDEHPSTLEQAGLWYGKDLVDALLNGRGLNSGKSFADGARGGGFSGFR